MLRLKAVLLGCVEAAILGWMAMPMTAFSALGATGVADKARPSIGWDIAMMSSLSCMNHLPEVAADCGVGLDLASLFRIDVGVCGYRPQCVSEKDFALMTEIAAASAGNFGK